MINILIKIILIVAGVFLYVRWLESRSLFYPVKEVGFTPRDIGAPYEEITFTTPDGVKLRGWLIRSNDNGRTVLYCHGNAGNIGDRMPKLKILRELGLNVFIFDYRGYGESEGKPSEEGVYLDARAAYDHLTGRPDIDKDHIAVYGVSLGGAVAIDLAVNRKIAGMVIDSSFTSAREMAQRLYPFLPSFFMKARFDSASKVKDTRVPKLFLHSREDTVVPFAIGEKLFRAAAEPKEFVEVKGPHGESNAYDAAVFREAMKTFFEKIGFIRIK